MIKKIISSLFLVSAFIALTLYSFGVRSVQFDSTFYTWVNGIVYRTNQLQQYSIPQIPNIPLLSSGNWWDILTIVYNAWAQSINLLNVLIKILNSAIYVFKFIYVFIESLNTFPNLVQSATTSVAII